MIHIDERKWPDRLHWQFETRRLGEDEHGVWLYAPPGTIAQCGDEPPKALYGFVTCVPDGEWWLAEFYWNHPWHEVYVNIGTPPVWDGRRVSQIDLDLDVARRIDGTVVVLDEDEFDAHRARYGYPVDLIAAARKSTEAAVMMLENGSEPFGSVWRNWLEAAGHG